MISDLHYVDEGEGPPLLLLHGNPTSSFLYRHLIAGLRDRFRCIAPDLPGFGRSKAPAGYGYTPVEHAAVIEQLVVELDLQDVTMMVQDWGGPIGFAVAGRHPERFSRFVVGNTWAWPKSDIGTRAFSAFLGGPIGKQLILHRNWFVERVMPMGTKRDVLGDDVMATYREPFPTAESRVPASVFSHAHVLPITNREKRSGWRVATAKPIGPPQSCTIIVTSVRSSSTTSCSITAACSTGV